MMMFYDYYLSLLSSVTGHVIHYISGKISGSQFSFFLSVIVLHVLKLLEAFWSKKKSSKFQHVYFILRFFSPIELFSSIYYITLSCQKCIKNIVVEEIEVDIESHSLLT